MYGFSFKIHAPLEYVFNWCTDFREEDPRITGSTSKRLVLEKSQRHAIYVVLTDKRNNEGKTPGRIYLVKFEPPYSWHLEAHGKGFDTVGKYRLSSISSRMTRLRVDFKHTYYDTSNLPSNKEKESETKENWKKYIFSLERDFNPGSTNLKLNRFT